MDAEYRLGASLALQLADAERPDLVILQSRSPSCGVKQIYDGTFTGTRINGQGITARMLMDAGYRVIDIADLQQFLSGEQVK